MTKKRKVPRYNPNACPRCGKRLERVSGLRRCEPCGYTEPVARFDAPDPWEDGRPDDLALTGGRHILPTNKE